MIIGINARFLAEPRTGLGQFTLQLCQALFTLAPEEHFHLYVRPQDSLPDLPGGNARVITIPITDRDRFDRSFTETDAFHATRPDLLHLPQLPLPANSLHVPTLLTVHDLIPAVFMRPALLLRGQTPLRALNTLGIAARFRYPAMFRRTTLVNTISATSARDLEILFGMRAAVIPNGLDPDFLLPTDPAAVSTAMTTHNLNGQYCINFGGLAFRKNLGRQLRAFRILRKKHPLLQFAVVGEGFWKRKAATRTMPGVVFTGQITRNELKALAAGAAFSLYPSLYEGFGLPVLESLALGVPVLTSRDSAMAEILPGSTLLADPRSVPALAAGMESLLRDRVAWQKKVRAARPGLDRYSWENAARRYLELYRQAAAST